LVRVSDGAMRYVTMQPLLSNIRSHQRPIYESKFQKNRIVPHGNSFMFSFKVLPNGPRLFPPIKELQLNRNHMVNVCLWTTIQFIKPNITSERPLEPSLKKKIIYPDTNNSGDCSSIPSQKFEISAFYYI
jgi:hypothetical protein